MSTEHMIFCPNCGTRNFVKNDNTSSICSNTDCNARLYYKEQYHDGGFQVGVRFD